MVSCVRVCNMYGGRTFISIEFKRRRSLRRVFDDGKMVLTFPHFQLFSRNIFIGRPIK